MGHELTSWIERRVLDVAGEPVGVVADVYTNPTTRRPTWLAIGTGPVGDAIAVAPVRGASLLGEDVVIAVDRRSVLQAPRVDVVVIVEPEHELFLSSHYTRSAHPASTPTRRYIP